MTIHIFKYISFLFVIISFSVGMAQQSKKTTVNFEDQLIEGQANNPDIMLMLKKRKFNYKKLIRLRENFLPELRKSAHDNVVSRKKGESR